MKNNNKLGFIFLMLIALFLAGCSTSSFSLGWNSSNQGHEMTASYSTFSGTEFGTVFDAEMNQTVTIHYDIQVNKGTLEVSLERLNGETIWQMEAAKSDGSVAESQQVSIPAAGRYRVRVVGKQTGGSYAISWLTN